MPFAGEGQCVAIQQNKKRCENKAFYVGQLCKVHTRKNPNAALLPTNPNQKIIDAHRLRMHAFSVERQTSENRAEGKLGQVVCSKLRMRHAVEEMPGFLKVFPNNRHGDRADGYGCSSLSPMRMGPIAHGQPIDVLVAKNLENLHQANKVFSSETIPGTSWPNTEWYATRARMYNDDEPHRHKEQTNGEVPLYSIWVLPDGSEKKLQYVESRQIYCHFYEKFARASPQFQHLQTLRAQGTNLQIIGYDARPVPLPDNASEEDVMKVLNRMYQDPSAPFGHELVLFTMLVIQDPKQYPWRFYQTLELN